MATDIVESLKEPDAKGERNGHEARLIDRFRHLPWTAAADPGQHDRRTTLPLAARGTAQPHQPMPLVIDIRNAEDVRDVVHRAVQALVEGQLVAFPTETVYGIGVERTPVRRVERLRKVKGRRAGAPFALAIHSAEEAADYVPDMPPIARRLARRCWPGPVTLVVENRHPSD